MPGWAGHRNLFVCLFSKAGIDFLSLLWIITQTGNIKPRLLQGLCPKWFSGSFCLEFSFFCPTEKENETRAGRPPGDRASALYSEMRNHCESSPGLTAKDYICASAQNHQSCSRDKFNNFSSSENKSYLPPQNKNWHVRDQDWRRIMQPCPHREQTF